MGTFTRMRYNIDSNLDYPDLDYSNLDYPNLDYLNLDYPNLDYPTLDYPNSTTYKVQGQRLTWVQYVQSQ